jgi:hypothetical protein
MDRSVGVAAAGAEVVGRERGAPEATAPPAVAASRSRATARLRFLLHPAIVLAACFGLGLATRLPGLHAIVTADEGVWTQRTLRFGTAVARGDLEGTYRTGHPGVTVMWVGLLGTGTDAVARFANDRYIQYRRLERTPGYLDVQAAARTAVAVVGAALAAVIVVLACKLLGPGPGLVGGTLLLLDPYLVGSLRVLHVDALLPPLMAISASATLLYWTGGRQRSYLILSALAGGLALLTKTPAAYLGLFFGLVALATTRPWRAGRRPDLPTALLPILAWGGIAAVVYVALWPALWSDPFGRLRDVAEFVRASGGSPHERGNFFLGQPVEDPGPLYYPVMLAFRLGPIALFGLLALPLAFVLARRRGHAPPAASPAPVLWLLAYVLLFVLMMTLGAKKLDRYMLPAIVVLHLLAGVGLWSLARQLRPAGTIAIAALLLIQAGLLWRSHPYPVAAYNPLLGGIAGAREAILVGWGEGLEQVAAYLNARPNAGRLTATVHYVNVLRPLFNGQSINIAPYQVEGPGIGRPGVDYFVIYVNAAQRQTIPPLAELAIEAGPPEFTAFVHGEAYAWLYRAPSHQSRTEAPTRSPDDEDEE